MHINITKIHEHFNRAHEREPNGEPVSNLNFYKTFHLQVKIADTLSIKYKKLFVNVEFNDEVTYETSSLTEITKLNNYEGSCCISCCRFRRPGGFSMMLKYFGTTRSQTETTAAVIYRISNKSDRDRRQKSREVHRKRCRTRRETKTKYI